MAVELERLFDEGPDAPDPHHHGDAPPQVLVDEPAGQGDEPEREPPDPPEPPATTAQDVLSELGLQMDELREQLEHAFDEVVARINRVELRQAALRKAADAQQELVRATEGRTTDLLAELRELAGVLDELGRRTEGGLAALHRQLVSLHSHPPPLDLRTLEDAAGRGALRNAADIANLQRDVDQLTAAVAAQGDGIAQLTATLGWIKDRLLLLR